MKKCKNRLQTTHSRSSSISRKKLTSLGFQTAKSVGSCWLVVFCSSTSSTIGGDLRRQSTASEAAAAAAQIPINIQYTLCTLNVGYRTIKKQQHNLLFLLLSLVCLCVCLSGCLSVCGCLVWLIWPFGSLLWWLTLAHNKPRLDNTKMNVGNVKLRLGISGPKKQQQLHTLFGLMDAVCYEMWASKWVLGEK